jgi:hypothetical protein
MPKQPTRRKTTVIDPATHPEAYPRELPDFASPDEAAEFFDTHSVAPYLDQMEEVTDQVTVDLSGLPQKGALGKAVVLRLPDSLHRDLARVAKRDGVTVNELVLALIARGLEERTDARATRGTSS